MRQKTWRLIKSLAQNKGAFLQVYLFGVGQSPRKVQKFQTVALPRTGDALRGNLSHEARERKAHGPHLSTYGAHSKYTWYDYMRFFSFILWL